MRTLYRSAPFLTLVASMLSVTAAFVIPYSRFLFSSSFSWAAFCLATFLPIDRFFVDTASVQKYRRIDVVVCSTCIVLSSACASLLGERGNGLAAVLIPVLVHILRFQYMAPDPTLATHDKPVAAVAPVREDDPHVDPTTLFFITTSSFLALVPNYPGASQLLFGVCSSIFSATYLSISDISIPLNKAVLREIAFYTSAGLLLVSGVLDGWSGWTELTSGGLAKYILLWSLFSAVKNMIIMFLIQQLSPINASFVDLIGILSTSFYTHVAWKIVSMCLSYMAIASTLLPPAIGERKVRFMPVRLGKLITLVIAGFTLGFGIFFGTRARTVGRTVSTKAFAASTAGELTWNTTIHPAAFLVDTKTLEFENYVTKQSATYPELVKEYIRRYGVNPPPSFDKWYAFAVQRRSIIFDDYDSIYNSLRPFWGLEPVTIRQSVREALGNPDNFLMGIIIRDGEIVRVTGNGERWFEDAVREMLEDFVEFLPDMDFAINLHEEARVIVPYADLKALRTVPMTSGSKNRFTVRDENENAALEASQQYVYDNLTSTVFDYFARQPAWGHAKLPCSPLSPAKTTGENDVNRYSMSIGFVTNSYLATDICTHPSFRDEHGLFVRPAAFNIATDLVPVFSQSKGSTFSDILFPSPWYWAERVAYDASKDVPWADKRSTLYWRGSTTGGFSRAGSWRRSHRQRTVGYFTSFDKTCTMLVDGADVAALDGMVDIVTPKPKRRRQRRDEPLTGKTPAGRADAPGASPAAKSEADLIKESMEDIRESARELTEALEQGMQDALAKTDMAKNEFVEKVVPRQSFHDYVDVHFTSYRQCDDKDCQEQAAAFGAPAKPADFQDAWKFKFLLDMDGNGLSSRFYAFLKSRSLVMKQTVLREWHDSRLMPWVHYVPLSTGLDEGFETLKFLIQNDELAEYIAVQGQKWQRKALRREDMQIYFFRLLLEYGRVIDDNRDSIGSV
ncbi:glycosyl transferase family 90-domain-containing protein [Dipodascopsis tothii]|uniref:glycosyl transferase family 90-domain-containing protein n=1 Tax=Dipodascopsis tothii TaxID=44089 RepID=UPI0034CEEE2E